MTRGASALRAAFPALATTNSPDVFVAENWCPMERNDLESPRKDFRGVFEGGIENWPSHAANEANKGSEELKSHSQEVPSHGAPSMRR